MRWACDTSTLRQQPELNQERWGDNTGETQAEVQSMLERI